MATVEFKNIVKKFGSLTVLGNLNLTVVDGEFLVLLGPSGCGKTTLLNLLAGLLELNSGEIRIDGRDVTDVDPCDRGLAMVFQSYALYPTKTVYGNLKFGLSSRGLASVEVERRIQWAGKLLQIDHLFKRRPAQLSGGQRQRVAIGRALVKQVGLCLFDEPLSNLDAKLRTEMRMEIKKLHNQLNNTVVYVTHDQVEAMTMATRIAIMDKGVIQQVGTPDEIYMQPENLFVADFVGTPAMNMLESDISIDGKKIRAPLIGTSLILDLSRYQWRTPAMDGQKVMIGFRAEHVSASNQAYSGDGWAIKLPVQFVEKSGPDAIAFLELTRAARPIAVRIDPSQVGQFQVGKLVTFNLPIENINIFDAQNGRRL